MIIFPAIDLRQGRCVRLRQGDPDAETVFGEDPAAMARHWAGQGAEWLHVVNLDGALDATSDQLNALDRPTTIKIQHPGSDKPVGPREELVRTLPINLQRSVEIREAVDIPIQFGGGLRTLGDIRLALELGADRVVLGTVAIENPGLVNEAILSWGGERIVVGIDARDGYVATHGWQQISDIDVVDLGHQMQAIGVKRVVYTDIGRDGMLSGVNVEATARLGDVTGLHVIASGGVAGIEDIELLKDVEHFDIEGVITGQAIYTGALDLAEAIELGHRPLEARSAGIIPFRSGENGPEFLILYNWYYELWEFPRTPVVGREGLVEAATRGALEVAGQKILTFHEDCRSTLEYVANVRDYEIQHTVVYYLAEVDAAAEVALGDENHCEAQWCDYQRTWELLTETAPMLLPALDRAASCLNNHTTD